MKSSRLASAVYRFSNKQGHAGYGTPKSTYIRKNTIVQLTKFSGFPYPYLYVQFCLSFILFAVRNCLTQWLTQVVEVPISTCLHQYVPAVSSTFGPRFLTLFVLYSWNWRTFTTTLRRNQYLSKNKYFFMYLKNYTLTFDFLKSGICTQNSMKDRKIETLFKNLCLLYYGRHQFISLICKEIKFTEP